MMSATNPPARDTFDLEAAHRAWRSGASIRGTGPTVLDELEDHLLESFAALVRDGMTGEAAWRQAVVQLGDAAEIGRELTQLDRLPALDRAALGSLLTVAALAILAVVVGIAMRGPEVVQRPVLTMHVVAITAGYIAGLLATAAAAYLTLRTLATRSAVPGLQRVTLSVLRFASASAAAFVAIGFLLGSVWASDALGSAFSADPREVGALLVVACFLAVAIATWTRAARSAPAIALAGGGAVFAAWFGAAAYAAGFPTVITIIGGGGLAACVLLAGLAFAGRERQPVTL